MNPSGSVVCCVRGSEWHRWDLHLHTPASFDYQCNSVTNNDIVEHLVSKGVRVVAITDHHRIDVPRIQQLQEIGKGVLTVLPGIELRDDHGGKPIHYIALFPEDCQLEHVWTTIQGKLELTPEYVQRKGGDERIYVPIEVGARVARELGGIVTIHAGRKSNSLEEISNGEKYQQKIKFDITQQYVDILEIGRPKDRDDYLERVFPCTREDRPIIICSDNHDIRNYSSKASLWICADPCFRGLLMSLREPFSRVFLGDQPPEMKRVAQNPTKYIKRLFFKRALGTPEEAQWFEGEIAFNSGLVAIIGNKGSGKSALADSVGLLGSSRASRSFSFLNAKRFCHPRVGYATHFSATLEWQSGRSITRQLDYKIGEEETETVRYLPQAYVEDVCNDLNEDGDDAFESELKQVIFSHVSSAQRLGQTKLDDLINSQTEQRQYRIDELRNDLRRFSFERSLLEEKTLPAYKLSLESNLRQRKEELEEHDRIEPRNPSDANAVEVPADRNPAIQEINRLRDQAIELDNEISASLARQLEFEKHKATAVRVQQAVVFLSQAVESALLRIADDIQELGLDTAALVQYSTQLDAVDGIIAALSSTIQEESTLLNGPLPAGLRERKAAIASKQLNLEAGLDAPRQAYQAYLRELEDWHTHRSRIVGDASNPDSLEGITAELVVVGELPDRIRALQTQQLETSRAIHKLVLEQAGVYKAMYAPVQEFIESHRLASNRLQIEFRVDVVCEGFVKGLLSRLALNKIGSFMGMDEGNKRAIALVEQTNWNSWDSIASFLGAVDHALHSDLRASSTPRTYLQDQVLSRSRPEQVFDFVFGLEYLRPKYVLQWDGKDLSMLSPGERGILLLVFYLLVDKGDSPLIIDQPEGNLDNHTISRVLVECIREAKKRRQIFVVTHNPNLAVVCDADQVVHATRDVENGNRIRYECGSLENPRISRHVTDVLEGTRFAFDQRRYKYDVAGE